MATIEEVERILAEAGSPDVADLRVIQGDDALEIHGRAETVSARLSAFDLVVAALGDPSGIENRIELEGTSGSVSDLGEPSTANDILDDEIE